MMQLLDSLLECVDAFDVVVLDQFGVLHNGTDCYPRAIALMHLLNQRDCPIVVLSNSGKRAELNRRRIESMGLPIETVSTVITSGEVLWRDLNTGDFPLGRSDVWNIFPLCGAAADAGVWSEGHTGIQFTKSLSANVNFILLMGLPSDFSASGVPSILKEALQYQIPLVCSNPDQASPRPTGLVESPGVVARTYEQMGGTVMWYGKPHARVFEAVRREYPGVDPKRFLMVGDSLNHDVAGGQGAGFSTALIRGGIHAPDFECCTTDDERMRVLRVLLSGSKTALPDFCLPVLA